jgi:hypothetical protein
LKSRAIIFTSYLTQEWIANSLALRKKLECAGVSADIIDVSSFSFPRRTDFVVTGIARIEGLEILRRGRKSGQKRDLDLNELEIAAEQSMMSLLRQESFGFLGLDKTYAKQMMTERAVGLWDELWARQDQFSYVDSVYVPNGRFPHEKVLASFFKNFPVSLKYWEMSGDHDGYFIDEAETHLWSRHRKKIDAYVSENINDQEKLDWAEGWIEARQSGAKNPFAKLWRSTHEDLGTQLPRQMVVFFSSSSDELGAIPVEEMKELGHQHQALEILAQCLVSSNLSLVIRIHPNLLNKPFSQFFREFRSFRKLTERFRHVTLIPPWSNVNSYDLAMRADLIAVHGSTMGVEAAALGKRVLTTQRTAYSPVVGVLEVLKPNDIPKIHLSQNSMDKRRALLYLEYMFRHRVNKVPQDHHASITPRLNKYRRVWLILRDDPIDAIFAFWFNNRWKLTSKLIHLYVRLLPIISRLGNRGPR